MLQLLTAGGLLLGLFLYNKKTTATAVDNDYLDLDLEEDPILIDLFQRQQSAYASGDIHRYDDLTREIRSYKDLQEL